MLYMIAKANCDLSVLSCDYIPNTVYITVYHLLFMGYISILTRQLFIAQIFLFYDAVNAIRNQL